MSNQETTETTTQQYKTYLDVPLNPGEEHVGILLGKNGEPDTAVILLPGDIKVPNWEAGMKWAAENGGKLPSLRQLSLLRASAKEAFQPTYYWSDEQHVSGSGFAWFQNFGNGDQSYSRKANQFRVRAVRSVVIQ